MKTVPLFTLLVVLLSACMLSACASPSTPRERLQPIVVTVRFNATQSKEELVRVERLIRAAARGRPIKKTGARKDVLFTFTAPSWDALEALHHRILHPISSGKELGRPVFHTKGARVAIDYTAVNLNASIEVVVRFSVTPGAKLYYKPDGKPERDVSAQVDRGGAVALRVRTTPGQRHIYARTILGRVERFISINIHTQDVQEIPENQYPR